MYPFSDWLFFCALVLSQTRSQRHMRSLYLRPESHCNVSSEHGLIVHSRCSSNSIIEVVSRSVVTVSVMILVRFETQMYVCRSLNPSVPPHLLTHTNWGWRYEPSRLVGIIVCRGLQYILRLDRPRFLHSTRAHNKEAMNMKKVSFEFILSCTLFNRYA